jgi:hypothetical protein
VLDGVQYGGKRMLPELMPGEKCKVWGDGVYLEQLYVTRWVVRTLDMASAKAR